MPHFLDHRIRQWTSARDAAHVCGHLFGRIRCAMCEKKDCFGHVERSEPALHALHQLDDVFYRRLRQNTVPEIEDVSRTSAGLAQNLLSARAYLFRRRE